MNAAAVQWLCEGPQGELITILLQYKCLRNLLVSASALARSKHGKSKALHRSHAHSKLVSGESLTGCRNQPAPGVPSRAWREGKDEVAP